MEKLSGRIIVKLRNKSDEAVTSLEFVAAEIGKAADGEMMIPCLSLFKWLNISASVSAHHFHQRRPAGYAYQKKGNRRMNRNQKVFASLSHSMYTVSPPISYSTSKTRCEAIESRSAPVIPNGRFEYKFLICCMINGMDTIKRSKTSSYYEAINGNIVKNAFCCHKLTHISNANIFRWEKNNNGNSVNNLT